MKKQKTGSKNMYFLKIVRNLFLLSGIFFAVSVVTAFTTLPFWGIYWLGVSKSELKEQPHNIVLLGGGGMPGESNLLRSWHTAAAARQYPEAWIIIAMPGSLSDSTDTPLLIRQELMIRGICRGRILFENKGTNTRAQALKCKEKLNISQPLLIITSPGHSRRAVLSFKKAGFEKVNAWPAFENAAETDFTYKDDELGGRRLPVPDVGNSISIRYQFWNHLKYEIIFAREYIALCYYKIRGWI